MKSRSAITFGALCALLGLVAVCPRFVRADISLTSDEAAARIQTTSATLRARRAEIEAAEAAVSEARVALWPRVVAAGSYARLSPMTAPLLGNVVVTASPGNTPEN